MMKMYSMYVTVGVSSRAIIHTKFAVAVTIIFPHVHIPIHHKTSSNMDPIKIHTGVYKTYLKPAQEQNLC
jgi:hypothetical protein